MKLLLLDQFSDPGGAQQGLLDLLPAIRERGWEARVGLPGAGEMFQRVRDEGFAAERIECGPYKSGRKSVADVARFLQGTPRLARQIEALAEGVDAVYVNGPRLLPAAALARLRAHVVFHSHSLIGLGMMRRLAGWSLRRMDAAVIGNCEFVAAVWRPYARHVSVIYNGVSGGDALPPPGAPRPFPTVACIGRIAPEKGQLEFLAAAETIHATVPGARFAVIGAALFGEAAAERYDRAVRARAAGLPVEFRGWVEDVYAALAGVDLLLVPSAPHEATTRVILEAYAAGVPVIAFASGGIPEVVDNGVTGFLSNSVEEMAATAIALLRDPARRASMSVGARMCWERRFTLERYQREVLAHFDRSSESKK